MATTRYTSKWVTQVNCKNKHQLQSQQFAARIGRASDLSSVGNTQSKIFRLYPKTDNYYVNSNAVMLQSVVDFDKRVEWQIKQSLQVQFCTGQRKDKQFFFPKNGKFMEVAEFENFSTFKYIV